MVGYQNGSYLEVRQNKSIIGKEAAVIHISLFLKEKNNNNNNNPLFSDSEDCGKEKDARPEERKLAHSD